MVRLGLTVVGRECIVMDGRIQSKDETENSFSYSYPVEPDPLEIFAKYGLLAKPNTPATEFLSLLISKTSLETQKLCHEQIQGLHTQLFLRCCRHLVVTKTDTVKSESEPDVPEIAIQYVSVCRPHVRSG